MTARGVDFTGIAYLVAIGVVGVVIVYAWTKREAIAAALNPADQANLVNRASNSFVQATTGGAAAGGEDSLGGIAARLREWLSGDDKKIRDMLKGSAPSSSASAPAPWDEQLRGAWGGP